ncbi:MAG: hypothetical protein P4L36_02330 [Holophaga sp.]|nr:hypothetical protein [Holophaga sp.]
MVHPTFPSFKPLRGILLMALATAGGLVHAHVTMRCEAVSLQSCEVCAITAYSSLPGDAVWEWSIRTGDGGEFVVATQGPRILFRAPTVTAPAICHVQARVRDVPGEQGECPIAVAPRGAVIVSSRNAVPSGKTCRLEVIHGDGLPHVWTWSVREPLGGAFTGIRTGARNVFQAPTVLIRQTVHIQATDAATGVSGVCALTVLPHPKAPQVLSEPRGPMEPYKAALVPAMTPYADLPFCNHYGHSTHDIHFVDDVQAGPLNQCYLVNDSHGILVVAGPGSVARLPLQGRLAADMPFASPEAFPKVECTALAVRAPGTAPDKPWRMVVALSTLPPRPEDQVNVICELAPDGTVTPIAGTWAASKEFMKPARALEASFDRITGLALDREGNLFVAEGGEKAAGIRRISGEGLVTPVTCLVKEQPGWWGGNTWSGVWIDPLPKGLVLNPETGDMYTKYGHAIRQITASGVVTTVLGVPNQIVCLSENALEGEVVPLGTGCLANPEGMYFHRGILYIAERGNGSVRAFDPVTRTLRAVFGYMKSENRWTGDEDRLSMPLRVFSPDLPMADCAAFSGPRFLAVNGDMAMVGRNNALVRIDLPEGWLGTGAATADAPPAPTAESKEESKEEKREAGPAASGAQAPHSSSSSSCSSSSS